MVASFSVGFMEHICLSNGARWLNQPKNRSRGESSEGGMACLFQMDRTRGSERREMDFQRMANEENQATKPVPTHRNSVPTRGDRSEIVPAWLDQGVLQKNCELPRPSRLPPPASET